MGTLFVYILKSALCLALFYLFYKLLLSRETFHRFNRVALLTILIGAWVTPLIALTVKQPTDMAQAMITLEQLIDLMQLNNPESVVEADQIPLAGSSTHWAIYALIFIYFGGIALFAGKQIFSFARLAILIHSNKKEKLQDGITLCVHQENYSPFSWMRYIVISEKDLKENGCEILIHETAHIQHRHSPDIILSDLCILFQWFNPAAWLLKDELKTIHEYEADEAVLRQGVDAKQYQLLLIKKAVGTRLYSMANSLNHSTLKKRITMMLKEKSSPWARLKYLYILPLAAVTVTAFARPEISETMNEISNAKISDLISTDEIANQEIVHSRQQADPTSVPQVPEKQQSEKKSVVSSNEVYSVVQHMPEFPGGMKAMKTYIQNNLKVPETYKEHARVIVQFVVNETGKVTDAKIIRGIDPELDAEAIRLVTHMPNWNPGTQNGENVKCKYTLPITFNEKNKNDASQATESWNLSQPLVYIDGKEVSREEMKSMDPSLFDHINILKDDKAIEKYGENGKNGVIEITLK